MTVARRRRLLVLCAVDTDAQTLSYQVGWTHAFATHPHVEATLINVAHTRGIQRLVNELRIRRRHYDAMVLLHSIFANGPRLAGRLFEVVKRHPAPKAFFIGNEYKLMPQKMAFAEELGIGLLVSQTSDPTVHGLYAGRLGCPVIGIVGGGLDPSVFYPTSDFRKRSIDVGLRANDEPLYFGHQDRRALAAFFVDRAPAQGLRIDVSFDRTARLEREGYAAFLNRCRGQIGAESGTDYFELDDAVRTRVNTYLASHPGTTIDVLRPLFFENYRQSVPCRTMSGRHVEAAATKTVQILFEGHYNGLFDPDVHYIALRRDFSNAVEVFARFKDDDACHAVVENAFEVACAELTYTKLIDRFLNGLRDAGMA
jgi:hypothetical protein